MKHSLINNYVITLFTMLLASILSKNVLIDSVYDIRFRIYDFYMTLLMLGWMFVFLGLIHREIPVFCIGLSLVIFNIWSIKNKFLITEPNIK